MTPGDDDKSSGRAPGSFWSRLSPLHKKRFLQGVLAYLVLVALVAGWIALRADRTLEHWHSRIPQATAPVLDAEADALLPPPDDAGAALAETPLPPLLPVNGSQPAIALIMTDLGLSEQMTLRALAELPPGVAIAFSPYSPALETYVERAAQDSRDMLMLLPMEPLTYPKDDPGPKALLTRLSDKQNAEHLAWLLSRAAGIAGGMNYMGSRFLADAHHLRPVFAALDKRGMFFVENPGAQGLRKAAVLAGSMDMPYLAADATVDLAARESEIRLQLVALEKIAAERGYAVGILHPYPVTLDVLPSWAETLARRGLRLVPPSTILREYLTDDKNGQNGQNVSGAQP